MKLLIDQWIEWFFARQYIVSVYRIGDEILVSAREVRDV